MQPLGQAARLKASITNAHHGASRARVDGRAATLQCHARPQCDAQLQRHGPCSSRRLAPCTSDHVTVVAVNWLAFRLGPLGDRLRTSRSGPCAHERRKQQQPPAAWHLAGSRRRGPPAPSAARELCDRRALQASAQQCEKRAAWSATSRQASHSHGRGRHGHANAQLAARARGIRLDGRQQPTCLVGTHARAAASKRAAAAQVVLGRAALSNPSTVPVAARTAASSSQV
jgi:hypothetical protein